MIGQYIAEDLVNMKTGEIHAEAGEEITEDLITNLRSLSYKKIPILDIDHINIGAFLRNTLAADKNSNQEEALNDIYRVMRPGEPPTPETAGALFKGLFFDSERYDLSAIGRVKMNMRLQLECEDTVRTLRKEDILGVLDTLIGLARWSW